VKRNVGRIDGRIRIVVGVAVAVLAFLVATGEASVPVVSAVGLAVAGVVLIVEGATRRCLLYRILGIDRCPME
jgi:preprotein translocase subunit Sec61beta